MEMMFLQEILLVYMKYIRVEINDFNGLIDNKPFFDQAVKIKQEAYENPVEMSGKDD